MTASESLGSINPAGTCSHNRAMPNLKAGAQLCDEGVCVCLPLHRASAGGRARGGDLSRRRVLRQPVPEQALL